MKSAMIRARVEDKLKKDVEGILYSLGMSPSEAINIFYSQIKLNNGIPFEVKIPNNTTLKTFKKTDKNKSIKKFKNKEEMFKSLKI